MRTILVCVLFIGACSLGKNEQSRPDTSDEPVALATAAATQVSVWHSVQNGSHASASFWDDLQGGFLDVWQTRSGRERGAELMFYLYYADPDSEVCVDECYCDNGDGDGDPGGGPAPGGPPGTGGSPGGDPTDSGVADGGGPLPPPGSGGGCGPDCYHDYYCYYSRSTFVYGYGQLDAADFRATPNRASLLATLTPGEDFEVHSCTYDDETGEDECQDLTDPFPVDMTWTRNGMSSYFNSGVYRQTYDTMTYQSQGSWRGYSADVEGSLGDLSLQGAEGSIGSSHDTSVQREVYRD